MDVLNKENLKDSSFLFNLFGLLFLVLPGVATIFVFEKEIFISLDWIKLVMLVTSITLPLALINIIASVIFTNKSSGDDSLNFSFGIMISGISVYLSLALSYFTKISLTSMLIIAVGIDVLVWVILWRIKKSSSK
ncbi:MAG: hypothetical protein Q7S43_02170 [bacterium]|nr:hypothetical protein [bacterium]